MQDILADLDQWLAVGHRDIGLATVVETWGSAPRRVGAKMAFTSDGLITGSVSGGCVEGAVIEVGLAVLQTGVPQLLEFGVTDEIAWDVGLACGGRIAMFVEPLDHDTYRLARSAIRTGEIGKVATIIQGPESLMGCKVLQESNGVVASTSLPLPFTQVISDTMAATSDSQRHTLVDGADMFVDVFRPPPTLIIIGGAHIAVALARLAKTVGYATIVIDPRRAFGSRQRFPDVDRLLPAWPAQALLEVALTAETAVVTLTHDPKIDDPALQIALGSPVFYVGALGSRQTHASRCERLAALGMTQTQLTRIHAPVGLDIGADNPEEIALAIMAEVVEAYRRRR